MSEVLIELLTEQSRKLDEHLNHLRSSIHDTNNKLQGVIGTVQLTRKDLSHQRELYEAQLEALKSSFITLRADLDKLEKEITTLEEHKVRVEEMYTSYNWFKRAVIGAIATGIIYAVVLVTKVKSGG